MKVMIAGAGSVGSSIARELVLNSHEVLIVDQKAEMAERADLDNVNGSWRCLRAGRIATRQARGI